MTKRICAKGDAICIPSNYSKFDLPNETMTVVHVGIDIKDIPKIDDQEYSITLNAFFVVRWTDKRMIIDGDKMDQVRNYAGKPREKTSSCPPDTFKVSLKRGGRRQLAAITHAKFLHRPGREEGWETDKKG